VYRPGAYDLLWLGAALVALAPGVFVAVCRQALARFSRKTLLEKVPTGRYERIERFLGDKEAYERTLDRLDAAARCVVVACLVVGRLAWLEEQLAAAADAGVEEGDSASRAAVRLGDTPAGSLALAALVLAIEVCVVSFAGFELVPAVVGRLWPEAWLARFHGAITGLHRLFAPVRWTLETLAGAIVRSLGGSTQRSSADIVEEEILEKVEEGEREGLLESEETEMIESIISFGDVEVSEVMTPRTEMVCLDLDDPLRANLDRVVECGHSRIPVYREHKDNVTGILYVKDLLKKLYHGEEIVLDALVRKPYCVPRTKKIDELLREFKQHRLQIAIVLDEFGGTDGLVTIEDILEEIVGDISDEYEKVESASIERVSEKVVDVDASVHIDDFNEELSLSIPEHEDYDTIGGFLFATLGRIPAVGDTCEIDGIRFEVTSADERRVHRLRVHLPEGTSAAGDALAGKV
jgi:putative hemolysin